MAMKVCKDCGTELSSKAKICPKCGLDQRNFYSKHKVLMIVLAIVCLVAIGAAAGGGNNNTMQTSGTVAGEKTEEKITLEKFNKIETGMTYQQVVEIIGEEGTVLSETNISNNEKYHTIMYSWKAKNGVANANVTIQGGKVVSKAQIGLN